MKTADPHTLAWELLAGVPDPEVPVLSVVDLGIVREVAVGDEGRSVRVALTPTYSGCPAMRVIEQDVEAALAARFEQVDVTTVLSPPWTTDDMSEDARRRLADYGIAPPHRPGLAQGRSLLPLSVVGGGVTGRPAACPHCGSDRVELVSEFGSTACKALYRCAACAEPFDYFKAH